MGFYDSTKPLHTMTLAGLDLLYTVRCCLQAGASFNPDERNRKELINVRSKLSLWERQKI